MSARSKNKRREGPNPLEWIESALHLLRSAPRGALLCYYFGSIPGLLGLLYYWADMSRGAFAESRLMESSFGAALFYVWMKCWQAVFLSKLRTSLFLEAEEAWTAGRICRLVIAQLAFQPLGLFLRLIAANLLIPYVWTYSLFTGAAILGDGTTASLREIFRRASSQAGIWWRQTHLALLCVFGFAFFIFLNLLVLAALLPYALRMFMGIETPFTRSALAMFNSSFIAVVCAAAYLCFDPVRKALFVVRHFHAASLKTGEDLRVGLKDLELRARPALAACLAAAALVLAAAAPARADEPAPPAKVGSSQLSDSLDRVLERREYTWRFPRSEHENQEHKGKFENFFENVVKTVGEWLRKAGKAVDQFTERWRKAFHRDHDDESHGVLDFDLGQAAQIVIVVLAAAILIFLAIVVVRMRRAPRISAAKEAMKAAPDLNEESVTADQLPEDGWQQLARDLIGRGEFRLALRAFYLATLAHLGERELIHLARHKSNFDYDRELQRRARGNAGLLDAFDGTLTTFERGWYGDHSISREALDGVAQNLERIRAC